MQLANQQQVLEHNRQFHWVISTSLTVNINTNQVVMPHDSMADMIASMGPQPLLDMGMPKPHGEWLAHGACFAPAGKQTNACAI